MINQQSLTRQLVNSYVQELPEDALPELIKTLLEMKEFYKTPVVPLKAPEILKSFKAKVTGSYIVPVYPIEDE